MVLPKIVEFCMGDGGRLPEIAESSMSLPEISEYVVRDAKRGKL